MPACQQRCNFCKAGRYWNCLVRDANKRTIARGTHFSKRIHGESTIRFSESFKHGVCKVNFAQESFITDNVDLAFRVLTKGDDTLRGYSDLTDFLEYPILLGECKDASGFIVSKNVFSEES